MAKCPFAKWTPISGPVGSYVGGPFKIVHHTTEGSTAAGAMGAFKANRSDPHFTIDATTIYQHIDTGLAARSLRNAKGGVETNRLSAIQLEIVGTATKPKARPTLENVARLCRWLEQTHNIPNVWPSGPPKPAVNGKDPGGHNRSVQNWVSKGGHYGHSHVPENSHWDPAYTTDEVTFLTKFDPDNRTGFQDPSIEALRESLPEEVDVRFEDIAIPDHADVGEDDAFDEPEAEGSRGPGFSLPNVTPDVAVALAGILFLGTYLIVRGVTRQART